MSFRYRKFKVYTDAIELYKIVIRTTKNFPRDYDYLRNQICRAALSVILNIAEGSAKASDKDFNRFLTNSLGSVSELVAGCEVSLHESLITHDQFQRVESAAILVNNQLGGFSKKLKS